MMVMSLRLILYVRTLILLRKYVPTLLNNTR